MKKEQTRRRRRGADPKQPLSESKRISHLSGIKVVKAGEAVPEDVKASGEFYDLLILPTFTLCACYLGYANYRIIREEKIEIPVGLIWELFNFTSGLTAGKDIMERHMMIIEKSFELLGYRADLSIKDDHRIVVINGIAKVTDKDTGKMKLVGFNEKGVDPNVFSQMLMRALLKSFGHSEKD
jgi:hypothetical protein